MEKIAQLLKYKRHDYLNHLQVISGYLQLNKTDKAKEYIKEVSNQLVEEGQLFQQLNAQLALSLIEFQKQLYIKGCLVRVTVSTSLPEEFKGTQELVTFLESYSSQCQIPLGVPCELDLELGSEAKGFVFHGVSTGYLGLVEQGKKVFDELTVVNCTCSVENNELRMVFPLT